MPDNSTGNPNDRYNESATYTISSISDADAFCNKYNHANNYSGLALGQSIKINDGTYNINWYIAGFDCEYNHTASDGTIRNNGYGIVLIPVRGVCLSEFGLAYSEILYIDSKLHTELLPEIATKLQTVLGSHLINRNVLLANGAEKSSSYPYYPTHSNSYKWTTSYCTLMSGYQLTGTAARYCTKYDDGEANYKLPLFNYIDYRSPLDYWLRGTSGSALQGWIYAYCGTTTGINQKVAYRTNATPETSVTRPMIYIR